MEYIVPGRIELVGKHVDYAGGRSLTCAIDLAVHARGTALDEPVIRLRSEGQDGELTIPLGDVSPQEHPPWGAYAAAVARRFARDFPQARRGVALELTSDLPISAGLSSSSAVVVAVAMALTDANDMEHNEQWNALVPDDLARAEYFAAMETGAPFGTTEGESGVGVRGGGQDHVAIVCGREGCITQFSYLPARLEQRVSWPANYVLAVGVSGVEATKTGNARAQYNRASDATRALVTMWNESTSRTDATLAHALASSPEAHAAMQALAAKGSGDFTAQYLVQRLAQFREEVDIIVPAVANALADENFERVGAFVDRSQQLAELSLENQVAETKHLARNARGLGAVAASAFGAGFGGAVWAMILASDADRFLNAWRCDYELAFPGCAERARWVVTKPAAPARRA